MIDLLYLTHNRLAFTQASVASLVRNTQFSEVRCLYLFDDHSTDGTREFLDSVAWPCETVTISGNHGGPVEVMKKFLAISDAELFAKIDNDVILPPYWLEACLQVMEKHPALDLLGIEPPDSRTAAPWMQGKRAPAPELLQAPTQIGYAPCESIGGIGLMRSRAWKDRTPMTSHGPNGVGGFTDWQRQHSDVCKGWIVPPLNLFLLDRLPFEPWASLSREYIAQGWQRPWTNYPLEAKDALWGWWAA